MKRLIPLLVLIMLLQPAHCQLQRETGHLSKAMAMYLARSEQIHDRLVLKLKDQTGIRFQRGKLIATKRLSRFEINELDQLNRWLHFNHPNFKPLLNMDQRSLDRKRQRIMRETGRYLVDLNTYLSLSTEDVPGYRFREELSFLNSLSIVQVAYLEAPNQSHEGFQGPTNVAVPGMTPILVEHQGYFRDAPEGVGMFSAWNHLGGAGGGVKVIVYDNNYRDTHEDLPSLFYTTPGNPVDERHGTAVLGILGAEDNSLGLVGGVHQALFGFQQAGSVGLGVSHAQSLLEAADQLDPGDVIVIEVAKTVQALGFDCPCNPTQANHVPLEFYPAEYDVISMMVASGISVVEAAGNGCVDFDSNVFQSMFDTQSYDSGAIWVAASLSDERAPTCYTNHGSRVDLHAWGESVAALLFLREDEVALFDAGPDRRYGPNFGGTSSATPIVAACVASTQAQAKMSVAGIMSPLQVRSLLKETGQPQTTALEKPIGPMPNMENINW
ncbi:S8 family serine peptidase [Marinicella meishanensis]|uniref:S8 family serine peptidase n=1 Tax=Marinicella meishanensis TaxID=2873263 RepID=UPI001CBB2D09|nr:S8 family serine peptidase [Marinicella sp. NBU2979]